MQLKISCMCDESLLPLVLMSKFDKLLTKLLNRNSTISYQEISYLLSKLGYEKSQKGKTSGSRVAFVNKQEKHIIRLHKPHPSNELKDYVKKEIIDELREKKLI